MQSIIGEIGSESKTENATHNFLLGLKALNLFLHLSYSPAVVVLTMEHGAVVGVGGADAPAGIALHGGTVSNTNLLLLNTSHSYLEKDTGFPREKEKAW